MSKSLIGITVLAAALTIGGAARSTAAETSTAPGARILPAQLKGTVVAVDRRASTVIVDVRGKLLTVNVTKQLRLTREGKTIELSQVVPGQTVTLTFYQLANGQIEVASIAVDAGSEPVEAAGGGKSATAPNKRVPALPAPAPFNFPPNPANVGGPPISPHH